MALNKADDQVFFEIYADVIPAGPSTVFWGLKREFMEPGPYTFQLQWAEAATAEFTDVGAPVVDTFSAVDPEPRLFAKALETYYRIILTAGNGEVFTSFPQQGNGVWDKRDWLQAREISRKEMLLLKKFVGWKGWLLKRKVGGPPCLECVDWDAHTAKGGCDSCFGTGKAGGYWTAVRHYWYPYDGFKREKKYSDNAGLGESHTHVVRMLSCPHVSTYDVLVNEDTGERFIVRNIKDSAARKGIPIVSTVELRLEEFSGVVYKIPLIPTVAICPAEPEVVVVEEIMMPNLLPPPEAPSVPTATPDAVVPAEVPLELQELIVGTGDRHALWFEQGEWWMGKDIGKDTDALFKTEGAMANPFWLANFDWLPVTAPAGATLNVSTKVLPTVFEIASSIPGLASDYIQAGTFEGTFTFLQEDIA